jgi:hypothetical protein
VIDQSKIYQINRTNGRQGLNIPVQLPKYPSLTFFLPLNAYIQIRRGLGVAAGKRTKYK